jgi:hypothetical protein
MIAVGVHSAAYMRGPAGSKSGPVTRRCDVLATRYDFILAPMLDARISLLDGRRSIDSGAFS